LEQLTIQLSDASGVPYYRQIVDQVALLIRSGQLPPNAQLPSVRDLAKQLLVSLITVRRSYADLEAQGFIVRRQGYGTYVSGKARKTPRKQALTEIRAKLSDVLSLADQHGLNRNELRNVMEELMARHGEKDGNS
jgi:GntR family transcriptional regulator